LEGKDDEVLRQLIIQGGSPGGARPKVTVARSNISDICLSGFDTLPDDYSHWIVKFRSKTDPKDMGRIELTYANMAGRSGVDMPYTQLIKVQHGKNVDDFFAVERFDRFGKNGKLHIHSLAGMMYANFRTPCMDYDEVLRATLSITKDKSQVEKAFRLMVFNVLTHNKDDHVKNFSFLYDIDVNEWKLSPGFDLTFSHGLGNEHTTAIAGSGNPNLESVLKIAKSHAIKNANEIIGEVRYGISQWTALAKQNGVSRKNMQEMKEIFAGIDSKFDSIPYCEHQPTVKKAIGKKR
jgi:serine/threonine-protein kinase HipA